MHITNVMISAVILTPLGLIAITGIGYEIRLRAQLNKNRLAAQQR